MPRLSIALVFMTAALAAGMETPRESSPSDPVELSIAGQGKAGTQAGDCSVAAAALPKGASRVYIAVRNGQDGSGSSLADARDGSTVTAFDTVLRCYSEGCANTSTPDKTVARTENLIVCLGAGTFSTLGTYDYIVGAPHNNAAGFTVGKGWKIHGVGHDKTILKLSDYISGEATKRDFPENTGIGLVLSTNTDGASNVEISDLTIDANYPDLKSKARENRVAALNLEAIHLRSDQGGNWIHDVNVTNTAGEIGDIHIRWEAFPVWIVSMNNASPSQNNGNVIENVTMGQSFGGTGCAITVANAVAEVRHNQVNGYPIGYGGWNLEEAYFHDNTAIDTEYGFNIDSLVNRGVRIESNHIIHPRKFGIVVGGGTAFAGFKILNNTVQINKPGVTGLLFRGNFTDSIIAGNTLLAENSSAAKSVAIKNYSASRTVGPNRNNVYQGNQISGGMKVVFDGPSQKSQNCFFNNHDERGRQRTDVADNRGGPCFPEAMTK
ncbi:MAG: hypothetical protein WA738_18670 [Candidatus Angelobacter sp.]